MKLHELKSKEEYMRDVAYKTTSKEALEKLLHLHICYDCIAEKDCCKTCDSRLCYEVVKKDLEVLEILKKHLRIDTGYCGTSEFATHTAISLYWDNEELSVDSKEGKEHKLVKESLTNDK